MLSGSIWKLLTFQRYLLSLRLSGPLLEALSAVFAPVESRLNFKIACNRNFRHVFSFLSIFRRRSALNIIFPNAFPLWSPLNGNNSMTDSFRSQFLSIQNATVPTNTYTEFLLVQRSLAIAIFDSFD